MIYLLAFEIADNFYDYTELIEKVKSLSQGYQHPMKQVWFIKTDEPLNLTEVCDSLKQSFHSKTDNIFITELSLNTEQYQGLLPKSFWQWFKN